MSENERMNRRTEQTVLLLYSIYTFGMAATVLAVGWEQWIEPLILSGLICCWVCVVKQYRTYQFRAFLVSGMCLLNFLIYGVKAENFFGILSTLGALVILLALYCIPEIMFLTAAISVVLLLYHLLVAHSVIAPEDALGWCRMLLQIISIFTIEVLVYHFVKSQIQTRRELLETIDTLKRAEKSKDDFVANVSHEIRTPINTICGTSDILRMKELPDEIREGMDDIYTAGHSLLAIVSDILDFSELQSGTLELTEEPYNLSSTLNDVLNIVTVKKEQKKIDIQLECAENIPSGLLGDEQKIKRVLLNLAGNAIKFTQEGRIVIRVEARKESYGVNLLVSVKDTGIGMTPEHLENLFRSFNQADMGTSRQEGGIGLGLAISQMLVRKMGGFITVRSEYGQGSEFQFVVPQQVVDFTPIPKMKFHVVRHELNVFHAPTARILVVDDNEMNLKVMQGLLKPYQVQVYTASGGEDALRKLEEHIFDFIFMDHMMPGMDGVETLHRIRRKPGEYYRNVPVIALTANAIGGAREMFLSEGFQDYVAKPVDLSALERVLQKYVPSNKIEQSSELPKPKQKPAEKDGEFAHRGIDTKNGLIYCGGKWEDYLDVMRIFVTIGQEKSEAIRQYFESSDWENYVIQVHALKSTSRTIGAVRLSEQAERLEKAGREKRISEIQECHGAMLQEYERLLGELKKDRLLFPEQTAGQNVAGEKGQNVTGQNAAGRNVAGENVAGENVTGDSVAEQNMTAEQNTYGTPVPGYDRSALYGKTPYPSAPQQISDEQATGSDLSEADFYSLLEELQNQLDSFQPEEAERVLAEAAGRSFRGRMMPELLSGIRSRVEAFDFLGAGDELEKLKERLR